ncbi:hypothetical protein CIPAW_15G067000 [Carya illinoinensis]|uniref:Uncharacterized protein n=1 Tax=Carya illinoinensis TaxID=32201 RepID=A0A8T1NAU3_CARIL|nr:hypothetical protein CIPAW_15G067000 [Carya illinoinensis]
MHSLKLNFTTPFSEVKTIKPCDLNKLTEGRENLRQRFGNGTGYMSTARLGAAVAHGGGRWNWSDEKCPATLSARVVTTRWAGDVSHSWEHFPCFRWCKTECCTGRRGLSGFRRARCWWFIGQHWVVCG